VNQPQKRPPLPPGVGARRLAVYVLDAVTVRHRTLDEAFAEGVTRLHLQDLEGRDRAFARLIATTSLRHFGRLGTLVGGFLEKPLAADSGRTHAILVAGAAQLVLLDTPPHAAISLSVDLARIDHTSRRFDKLINAILRRIAAEGKTHYPTLDVKLDCPAWLWSRWVTTYGEDTARQMFSASLAEPALDLTVKSEPAEWAAKLTGIALPNGTVRVREAGRIEDLPGFNDGAWWVQDAAASLPAQLLHAKPGERVADLCAAPGGKTAQLASAGSVVTAVDASAKRMARLTDNLRRLSLTAETVTKDIAAYCAKPDNVGHFDAVLLDAPCSATGTIRRHPDLLRIKDASEIERLSARQGPLLSAASNLVKPGGRIVYVTCSLEPEEGEAIVAAFLAAHPTFRRAPLTAEADAVPAEMITRAGDLRTLPHHGLGPDPAMAGLDGFYAARLERVS
jgi:16S rRNA (cytosine967-C5)-methyltransferase